IARTRTIHSNTRGEVKSCGAAGAICAASAASQTRKSAHHASGSDFTDGAVVGIGHIDVVRTVYCKSARQTETCGAAGAIGAASAIRAAGRKSRKCREGVRLISALRANAERGRYCQHYEKQRQNVFPRKCALPRSRSRG